MRFDNCDYSPKLDFVNACLFLDILNAYYNSLYSKVF